MGEVALGSIWPCTLIFFSFTSVDSLEFRAPPADVRGASFIIFLYVTWNFGKLFRRDKIICPLHTCFYFHFKLLIVMTFFRYIISFVMHLDVYLYLDRYVTKIMYRYVTKIMYLEKLNDKYFGMERVLCYFS
jgi:hypothetical protein